MSWKWGTVPRKEGHLVTLPSTDFFIWSTVRENPALTNVLNTCWNKSVCLALRPSRCLLMPNSFKMSNKKYVSPSDQFCLFCYRGNRAGRLLSPPGCFSSCLRATSPHGHAQNISCIPNRKAFGISVYMVGLYRCKRYIPPLPFWMNLHSEWEWNGIFHSNWHVYMTFFILMTGIKPFIPNELLHVNVATETYVSVTSPYGTETDS